MTPGSPLSTDEGLGVRTDKKGVGPDTDEVTEKRGKHEVTHKNEEREGDGVKDSAVWFVWS